MNKRDLFLVVADLDAESALKALLCHRQASLGIQVDFKASPPPSGDMLRYAGRDSGCYKDAVDILRTPQRTHRHAILVFDRDGAGAGERDRVEIENEIEEKLALNGWEQGTAAVIVIQPELESWIWSESIHVSKTMGWEEDLVAMRTFLTSRGLWVEGERKPKDPKEAFAQALKSKGKPRSAQLFATIARQASLQGCGDGAFRKLQESLVRWFGNTVADA